MKRIVVGIDGSEQGFSALARASELARATSAALHIVHVSPTFASEFAGQDFPAPMKEWLDAQETYSAGLLREAVARAKVAGLEITASSSSGLPAEVLADISQDVNVSMVVVGHRGRNLAARLLVGSVADRLVQIASKPVLVVR